QHGGTRTPNANHGGHAVLKPTGTCTDLPGFCKPWERMERVVAVEAAHVAALFSFPRPRGAPRGTPPSRGVAALSGGGGGGQRALGERLLPRRQRTQAGEPALDVAVWIDRIMRRLGQVERRAEREVGDRQGIPGDEFPSLQLTVQHLCGAVEQIRGLGDRRQIRLVDLQEQRLCHIFESKDRTSLIPVREVPELPARDVEPPALVLRQQAALRLLAGEVLQDRVRLPQHIVAIAQGRHAHVGMERGVIGILRLALNQMDEPNFGVEAEMVGNRHHLEGARARRENEQFDRHGRYLLLACVWPTRGVQHRCRRLRYWWNRASIGGARPRRPSPFRYIFPPPPPPPAPLAPPSPLP